MSDTVNQEILDLQEELIASEARFYNVVDISPDGIVVVDKSGVICFINDAAQLLFEKQRENLLGREFGFPVVSGGKNEIEIRNSKGRPRIVEMRVVTIMWEKEPAFLASLRDITEHTRLISALNSSNQELKQFSYAVSHDIKGPLRNMHTLAKWLIEGDSSTLDNQAMDDLKLIDDNANRMLRLVDGLLEFTEIEASDKHTATVDLNEVVAEALANINTDIVKSHADIVVGELPVIRAYEIHMVSLFQNLIGNSIKYCGDRDPKIVISGKKHQTQWEIAITDNGIGIEEQYWDRIFQPFERLHTATEYDGSGVGLASCRKIVDQHNGRIWIESELDKGTTFFVLLPEDGV